MSFPRYEQYKYSGVEWLGEIPIHWNLLRLRHVTELNPSKSEVANLDRQLHVSFLPMDAVGDDGSIRLDLTRAIGDVEHGYTYFREGDVTIAKITPCFENGKGAVMEGLLNGFGFGTTELIVVRPRTDYTSSSFLQWLFNSSYFRRIGESTMFGAGGQKRVSDHFVRNFATVFPPLNEQDAIVSFLDRETSKIDALVLEQRRLIELLKEKRQAVISHAVTKGLDPNVKMKPSGIEWLGDVPEHWLVARVKFASHRISKGDTPSNFGMDFAVDGPVRFIKIENIGDGELIETSQYSIDFAAHNQLKRSQLQANDIVFAIAGATTGKCAIVQSEHLPANTNQAVAYIRPNECVIPIFLVTWLQNSRLQEAMWDMTSKSAQPNLSMENLGNLPLPIPPKSEQDEIVRHVSKVGGSFLKLISEAERAIALLQERRTALISAAVTGKIDVRGFEPISSTKC